MKTKISPLLLLPILAAPLAAQVAGGGFDKRYSWYANTSGDIMGSAFASIGDIDGDGIGDLAVGAPGLDGPNGNNTPNYGRLQVFSGATGLEIYVYGGNSDWENVGTSVIGLGDMNGDSVPDFAYGSDLGNGTIYVQSGATGMNLLTIPAPGLAENFGSDLETPGDFNLDGVPDIFASATSTEVNGINNAGAAYVISGADGSLLLSFGGATINENFGRAIACPGDLDLDGTPDFMVSATSADTPGIDNSGAAYVFSGATGAVIHTFAGDASYDLYGWSVGAAGDMDRDRVPDVMVGHIFYDSPQDIRVGRVDFYSGASGSLIRSITGSEYWEDLGSSVSMCGDVNEDGVKDHILGADGNAYGGRAYIHSGATGDLLYICESDGYSNDFGNTVRGMGDLDGDGLEEFMVGATGAMNGAYSTGAAYLYEFKDFLSANVTSLSAAAGGTIALNIDFPDDWLFHPTAPNYAVLASGSGVGYSQVQGFPMPLIQDSIYAMTAGDNYTPHFLNPRGPLDANGNATSNIAFAPGQASAFIGTTFQLCAAWYEIASWGEFMFHGFSRPVAVTIVL